MWRQIVVAPITIISSITWISISDLELIHLTLLCTLSILIVIKISFFLEVVRQIKTFSRIKVNKNLSDIFPIRNGLKLGDSLLALLLNSALEYTSRRIQVNLDGLKLNGT
jgi:hypothetical protein